jgi:hypothetical protein
MVAIYAKDFVWRGTGCEDAIAASALHLSRLDLNEPWFAHRPVMVTDVASVMVPRQQCNTLVSPDTPP